jgi:acetylornithine deacetylase/succinyl-diaminopimelate desuccinylase-like protein
MIDEPVAGRTLDKPELQVDNSQAPVGEVIALLQQLIRNGCVNTGEPQSGCETRSVDVLENYLKGPGVDLERFEPLPERASLVARIEGTDRDAPTLCLMGHTDVVPATPEGWMHDPYGGELIDGEVWGRGAIDMLNLTASMAVTVRQLAKSRFRPKGTLIYIAVADEEAGGHWGAEWLLQNAPDAVAADYVITESGGITSSGSASAASARRVTLTVAEKGLSWRRLTVRGTPGHGSMPYATDNALVKAAAVITNLARYSAEPRVTAAWRNFAAALDLPDELRVLLLDPARVDEVIAELSDKRMARLAHACTHTTFSPNVARGGNKTNVVPDTVQIDVDVRLLPGDSEDDVDRHIAAALGVLAADVDVKTIDHTTPTESAFDTPLRDAIQTVVQDFYPNASLMPRFATGTTDARFYRAQGAIAYGFGLYSPEITMGEFMARFHGNNERVDTASLKLTTLMWDRLVRSFLT